MGKRYIIAEIADDGFEAPLVADTRTDWSEDDRALFLRAVSAIQDGFRGAPEAFEEAVLRGMVDGRDDANIVIHCAETMLKAMGVTGTVIIKDGSDDEDEDGFATNMRDDDLRASFEHDMEKS
ncbi:MAG TPA: hypothetical protein VGE72_30550 [Azospirillum sp.]